MESSTALETALAAWLAFMNLLGVDMQSYLLPPATEEQIVAVENEIGFGLPNDLRELYLIANGQTDYPYNPNPEGCVPDAGIWAPLFGNYEFLPLEKAIDLWRVNVDIAKDFGDDFKWDIRTGDPVDPSGVNRYWFVFAGGNANHYSVDTQPPAEGSSGQVVLHGADEWELQVVASSITELMQQAARELDPDDARRFQHHYSDTDCQSTLFFDMDWRNQIQSEENMQQEQEEFERQQQDWRNRHPKFIKWQDKQAELREQRKDDYRKWLHAAGYNDRQILTMTSLGEESAMGMLAGVIENGTKILIFPEGVLTELQSGEAEDFDNLFMMQTMALGYTPEVNATELAAMARAIEIRYLYALVSIYVERYSGFGGQSPLTAEEKIQLVSRYHLKKGMIPQSLYNGVTELLIELGSLPNMSDSPDTYGSQSFGMKDNTPEAEAIVEICLSDDCYEIPLLPYLTQ